MNYVRTWELDMAQLNIRHAINSAAGEAKREIAWLAAKARFEARHGVRWVAHR